VSTTTKIVVVSINADAQTATGNVLAAADMSWELSFFTSGREALAKVESVQPSAVIIDYQLMDMSGFTFFQTLQATLGGTAPVLMLIPQNDEAAVVEALCIGVQDYLFKDERGNYLAMLPTVLKKSLRERRAIAEKEMAQAALSQLERKYEYLFMGVTEGIILADEHRVIESINPAACAIFNYDASALIGSSLTRIMRSAAHPIPANDAFNNFLAIGMSDFIGKTAQEVHGVRFDGSIFPLELTITEINFDGRRMFASVMRDTSERHHANQVMQESEARFRGAFDNAPIGMALISLQGKWLKVNPSLCAMVGYSETELLSSSFQEITHPDDLNIDQTFVQLVLADQLKTFQMETRYFHKRGHIVPVLLSSSLVRNAENNPLYFISKIEDITQRKQMEDALYAEKDLAQTTLQSIGDAVITTDANGIVTYLNPMAERLTGWSNREACGQPLAQVFVIVDENTREVPESPVKKTLAEGKICKLASNTVLIAKNGIEYNIENSASPIRARDGSLNGVVMVFHDVTESRAIAQQIRFQASHDALTGLCNRAEFERVASHLLHEAHVMHIHHVLLYLDLDQFKMVNDRCGHLAGDQLLQQLSHLLLSKTRKSDTLARLGGDEFALLLEGCSQDRGIEIAQILIDTVCSFRFEWEGKLFSVGVSIGLVSITDQSKDLIAVLEDADSACYMAKEKGRNRVQVFQPSTETDVRVPNIRIDWIDRLQTAIKNDAFFLYYQEIQSTSTQEGKLHYEVLLRYQDAKGHMLLPMAFIPAAERHGLLPAIDQWVITRVLRHTPTALLQNNPSSFVAINISGASLATPTFQDFVLQALHEGMLAAHRICFEIAESVAITNLAHTLRFIQALKPLGCLFALDDFGSAPSSFNYLKSLPVDFLKIDGSLVKNIVKDPIDVAMLESILRVAQAAKVQCIAKNVENDDVLALLRRVGVHYVQGFALHQPELMDGPAIQSQ